MLLKSCARVCGAFERVPLRQWLLRITADGDRLANELDDLHWPESIKAMQKNWIGRSEGAEVDFYLGGTESGYEQWKVARASFRFSREPGADELRIYTTRPDTLFGVTYMVLAPEHPAVDRLTTKEYKEAVEAYRQQAATKSDLDRTDLAKGKSGVFTGGYAINPINGEQVPVWIADYVLISYGTGAIMAVPAHDERDLEFARQFQIEIKPVVAPVGDSTGTTDGFFDHGIAINSGAYNGLPTLEFKTKITADLEIGCSHASVIGASHFQSGTNSIPAGNRPVCCEPNRRNRFQFGFQKWPTLNRPELLSRCFPKLRKNGYMRQRRTGLA